MRKIKIRSSDGQESILISREQLEELKQDHKYEKSYDFYFKKAFQKIERTTYFKRAFWIELIWIALAALGTSIALSYLIAVTGKTGLFPGGIGSIARFLSVTFVTDAGLQGTLYFPFYFVLNIPFIIFGIKKIGLKFTLTTIIWIGFSIAFDFILKAIPYLRPEDMQFIIDYQLISSLSSEWNSTIWLFIFAIFAGIVNGWSYGIVYRAGSSTGGIDFVSMFYSKHKNKAIGTLNMKINFSILAVMIMVNTMMLNSNDLPETVRLSVLNREIFNEDFINQLLNGADTGFANTFKNWVITNGGVTWEEFIQGISTGNPLTLDSEYFELIQKMASDSGFTEYTSSMLNWMKFKFILGPSLFASIVMIIIQSIITDVTYPKNRIRTIMISTTKEKELQAFLYDAGYNNNIFVWEAETTKKGMDVENKKMLIISMTVLNWRKIDKAIMNVDNRMNINILGTKRIKGTFTVDFSDEKRQESINKKILENPKIMKKIENDAVIRTMKKQNKSLFKKAKQ
ncbi:YitT family ABC transporter [Mesoplasma photuris]|uniref:YitT family ABC transporter n=1 Tax=Mesoplasma photuris TaxID=217731 RepID=UPI0004E11254|nr:YitT family ABC transporter [Mesoplasma photuris]